MQVTISTLVMMLPATRALLEGDKQDDERHDRLEQYIHDVDLRGRRALP